MSCYAVTCTYIDISHLVAQTCNKCIESQTFKIFAAHKCQLQTESANVTENTIYNFYHIEVMSTYEIKQLTAVSTDKTFDIVLKTFIKVMIRVTLKSHMQLVPCYKDCLYLPCINHLYP